MPDELTTTPAVSETGPEQAVIENPVGETTAAETTSEASQPDFAEQIRKMDLNELRKLDPRIDGHAGNLAEKQTKKAIEAERQRIEADVEARYQARAQEQQAQRERDELLRLAREDPMTLAEKTLEKEALKDKTEADRKAAEAHVKTAYETVYGGVTAQLKAIYETLPDDEKAAIDRREFSPPDRGGIQEVFDVLMAAKERVTLTALVEKEVEKRKAVWLKEQLSETNGVEPSPDLSSGQPAGGNSDREFLADFAIGKTHDYARAMRLMGRS